MLVLRFGEAKVVQCPGRAAQQKEVRWTVDDAKTGC